MTYDIATHTEYIEKGVIFPQLNGHNIAKYMITIAKPTTLDMNITEIL